MIYLDNNATTEPLPEVRDAVLRALTLGPSNPSSPHAAGEPARRLLADAHDAVAQLIGASPEEVFFTSSGSEANNWALHLVRSQRRRHLVVTPVEHESVLRKAEILKAEGIAVSELPVDRNGVVVLATADKVINSGVGMVSVQWVNNETGVVQPIEKLAEMCHERGCLIHTDAAQAVGKLDINVKRADIDYLTFTGHKMHAPMGVGVLYRRQSAPLTPFLSGGMQESGKRPGSQNLAGIAGLAVAARLRQRRLQDVRKRLARFRDMFESRILSSCPGAILNTDSSAARVCNTTNIRFPGVVGEALLARLFSIDICCSQGSACTSQIPEPSHTLLAMGLEHEAAYQSIRFSFSELNSESDVEHGARGIAMAYLEMKVTHDRLTNLANTRSAG